MEAAALFVIIWHANYIPFTEQDLWSQMDLAGHSTQATGEVQWRLRAREHDYNQHFFLLDPSLHVVAGKFGNFAAATCVYIMYGDPVPNCQIESASIKQW